MTLFRAAENGFVDRSCGDAGRQIAARTDQSRLFGPQDDGRAVGFGAERFRAAENVEFADAPSVLQEEMLVPDFYPQKVTIVNGLYQSLMVMQQCQGYDLGTGFISESNGAQGVIKRPIKGFDDPITIGWVCQKAHTLSQPAERFIQLLQKYGRDLPEA